MTTPRYALVDTRQPDGCYVRLAMVLEPDPDVDPREHLFQDPDYRVEDDARLAAFRRGEWGYLGVRARAHVLVVRDGVGFGFSIDSAGLWGVESDSGDAYLAQVFADEVEDLKGVLATLANPVFVEERS